MSHKRNKGFLVPSIPNPPGRKCVRLWIPDEPQHIANFWGVLNFLTLWTEYERTGDTTGVETADVWKDVYLSARQYFELGDCDMPLELRNVDGDLEWRPDPSATWVSLGQICPCEDDVDDPAFNPDSETFETRACAIATGLTTWLFEKGNDSIDQVEAAADVVAASDGIAALFPPAYLIADILTDYINEFVEGAVAAARAFDTVDHREEIQEWLYCQMYATGEMTEALWADFKVWAISQYSNIFNPGYSAWEFYFEMIKPSKIVARARRESYGEGDCIGMECGYDWEQVYDFKTEQSLLGWVQRRTEQPLPTITAAGLQAAVYTLTAPNPDQSNRGVYIKKQTPYADSTTRFVSVQTTWASISVGSNNLDVTMPRAVIRTEDMSNVGIDATPGSQGLPANGTLDSEFNPSISGYGATDFMTIFGGVGNRNANTNQPVTGNGYLEKVRIRGLGKNPFVV